MCAFQIKPSKNQLHCQLNIPWSTTAQKRIADANVRCNGNRKKASASTGRRIYRGSHISCKTRQQWIGKVWMIEEIEDFGAQLYPKLLSDVSIFENGEVNVAITRSPQGVPTERTKMPGSGNA